MDYDKKNKDIDIEISRILYHITHKCITSAEEKMKNLKISFPQSVILHMIIENDDKDLCQKDIVDLLGIKGSSISSLINNMSKNGLIVRQTCSDDARKYLIKATDKGRDIYNEIGYILKSNDIEAFSNLKLEEKQQLLDILLKIV